MDHCHETLRYTSTSIREAIRAVRSHPSRYAIRVFSGRSFVAKTRTTATSIFWWILPEGMSLFDIGAIRWKLHDLLGFEVDVVSPRSLPESFRDRVLATAGPICSCGSLRSLRLASYLQHIIEASARIRRLHSRHGGGGIFRASPITQDAAIGDLKIIGKSCNNVLRHHASVRRRSC